MTVIVFEFVLCNHKSILLFSEPYCQMRSDLTSVKKCTGLCESAGHDTSYVMTSSSLKAIYPEVEKQCINKSKVPYLIFLIRIYIYPKLIDRNRDERIHSKIPAIWIRSA